MHKFTDMQQHLNCEWYHSNADLNQASLLCEKGTINLVNYSARARFNLHSHCQITRVLWYSVCVFNRESGSSSNLLADPRVNQLTNGGLEISNITQDDEGFYTCSVQNTNLSVIAELEVLSEWHTRTGSCGLWALHIHIELQVPNLQHQKRPKENHFLSNSVFDSLSGESIWSTVIILQIYEHCREKLTSQSHAMTWSQHYFT